MRSVAVFALVCLALTVTSARADFYGLRDASRLGNLDAVRQALDAGDDPNPPFERDGYSPLQFAAGNGHVEMTRLLLAAGADTEYRDHNGDRALLWAAQRGHAETVGLLLAAGSPPDADVDPYGITPLMAAAQYAHTEVVRSLLAAGADPHRTEQGGDTALHAAARTDDTELVRLLLEAGANPNVFETILMQTPLHQAALRSTPAVVRLLLDAGAGTEARDQDGRTPLFIAAMFGNAGIVDALIAAHADIDAVDLGGTTPLLAALDDRHADGAGRAATVALLAAYTRDLDRGFALALARGFPVVALGLLERGADINARDGSGRSALANTVHLPGLTYFQLLLNRGADLNAHGAETMLAAAEAGRVDIAAYLIEHGISVDTKDAAGATPLLIAARAVEVEMVRLLLAAGAAKVPVDSLGRGVDSYLEQRTGQLEQLIGTRQASRAYRPTLDLELDLSRLRAGQAEIRKLLAAE